MTTFKLEKQFFRIRFCALKFLFAKNVKSSFQLSQLPLFFHLLNFASFNNSSITLFPSLKFIFQLHEKFISFFSFEKKNIIFFLDFDFKASVHVRLNFNIPWVLISYSINTEVAETAAKKKVFHLFLLLQNSIKKSTKILSLKHNNMDYNVHYKEGFRLAINIH